MDFKSKLVRFVDFDCFMDLGFQFYFSIHMFQHKSSVLFPVKAFKVQSKINRFNMNITTE